MCSPSTRLEWLVKSLVLQHVLWLLSSKGALKTYSTQPWTNQKRTLHCGPHMRFLLSFIFLFWLVANCTFSTPPCQARGWRSFIPLRPSHKGCCFLAVPAQHPLVKRMIKVGMWSTEKIGSTSNDYHQEYICTLATVHCSQANIKFFFFERRKQLLILTACKVETYTEHQNISNSRWRRQRPLLQCAFLPTHSPSHT